jgi:hypothetical protein
MRSPLERPSLAPPAAMIPARGSPPAGPRRAPPPWFLLAEATLTI